MARTELIKMEPNTTEWVTLSFDEPSTGVTKGRQWIRYGVRHNGQMKSFFATSQGHAAIQELGAKKGDDIIIHVDSEGEWHVSFNLEDLDVPERVFDEKPLVPKGGKPRMKAETLESLVEKYESCLDAAVGLAQRTLPEDVTNEDVRSIATTLYIQGTREGIEFPKPEPAG